MQEATSPEAVELVQTDDVPYVLTDWQELDVRNALRLKVYRGEITLEELRESLNAFAEDIATGRWERPDYELANVHELPEQLSAVHAADLGCRTLDIVYAEADVVIGAKEFVTFDSRQGALAKKAGLKVKP